MARLIPILFVCAIVGSCRVVPIQMVRNVQMEHFEQTFDLPSEDLRERKTILRSLLGDDNVDAIYDPVKYDPVDGEKKFKHVLDSNEFKSVGNLVVSLGLSVGLDSAVVEGFGSYHITTIGDPEVIIFSGDFYVIPTIINIQDLLKDIEEKNSAEVMVSFNQYLISHISQFEPISLGWDEVGRGHYFDEDIEQFNRNNEENKLFGFYGMRDKPLSGFKYFHENTVFVKVIMEKYRHNKVLQIKYDADHMVCIDLDCNTPIGYIQFDRPVLDHKLIDLRGLNLVRKKY